MEDNQQQQTRKIRISKDEIDLLNINNITIYNYFALNAIYFFHEITLNNRSSKFFVPKSFIDFYIEECSLCKQYDCKLLNEFFEIFKKERKKLITLPKLFSYSHSSLVSKYETEKEEGFEISSNEIKNKIFYATETNNELNLAINKIKQIANYLQHSDELVSTEQIYYRWIVEKELEEEIVAQLKKDLQTQTEQQEIIEKKKNYVIGKSYNIPQSTGKVMRLVIPKFELPTRYPTSLTKSRVDSRRCAYKFPSAAKTIKILIFHNFQSVAYDKRFIDKRKNILKKMNRPSFSF